MARRYYLELKFDHKKRKDANIKPRGVVESGHLLGAACRLQSKAPKERI
ncbi:MAG: hypothetical protein HYR55_02380 [Acidobacteria bacterium]|nr:hypothetical protein [Acidobacteriota bacterium]MBI3655741.1 hypothetical protein [Acidobacteriota bacterium]